MTMHDDELDRLLDAIARPPVPQTHVARVLAADRSASPGGPTWPRSVRWAVPAAAVIVAALWLYPRNVVVPPAGVSSPDESGAKVVEQARSEPASVAQAARPSSPAVTSSAVTAADVEDAEPRAPDVSRGRVREQEPFARAVASARAVPAARAQAARLDDEHALDGLVASNARAELAPLPLSVIPISVEPIRIGPVADATPTVIEPIAVEPIVIDALPLDPSPQEHP